MTDKMLLKEAVKHGTTGFPLALYGWEGDHVWQVMPHWHEEMELICFHSGVYPVRVNTKMYEIKAPAVMCIHPGEIHSLLLGRECRESALVFHPDILSFERCDAIQSALIRPLLDGLYRFPLLINAEDEIFEAVMERYTRMKEAIKEIGDCGPERDIDRNAAYLTFKAALLELLAILYKNNYIQAVREETRQNECQIEDLKRVLGYIAQHYDRPITLSELAGLVNMNPQYFCRYFKKNIGKTVTGYINDTRLRKAADALLSTDRKIITIAQDCGYDNIGYFIRRFKAAVGCTPTQYRSRNQNRKSK